VSAVEQGLQAFNLHSQGKSNPEVKVALGLSDSKEAVRLIEVGRRQARIEDCRLTDRELAVILALAASERHRQAAGDVSAFNGKWLGGFGWRVGGMLYVMRKRLGLARKGEKAPPEGPLYLCTGLGLVDSWHGGGCRLTRAGWALVHAIEAERAQCATVARNWNGSSEDGCTSLIAEAIAKRKGQA
jgi:hypothetical protein